MLGCTLGNMRIMLHDNISFLTHVEWQYHTDKVLESFVVCWSGSYVLFVFFFKSKPGCSYVKRLQLRISQDDLLVTYNKDQISVADMTIFSFQKN